MHLCIAVNLAEPSAGVALGLLGKRTRWAGMPGTVRREVLHRLLPATRESRWWFRGGECSVQQKALRL